MIKIFSIVLFSIFYNFKSYCGCCGYCCVDPKIEIQRQFENLKIEDNDMLDYTTEKYSSISMLSVNLSPKDPAVTSKLTFQNIIKAKKYFKIFYEVYLSDLKKEMAEEVFYEGYNILIDKLVKDIGDKADFNYDQINNSLVFETEFSFKKSNYEKFNKEVLSSDNYNRIYNIICASMSNKSEFKVYFEPNIPTDPYKGLRKEVEADQYCVVYNSSQPTDSQQIKALESLGDNFFKTMKFIFIVFLSTRDFYILLSKEDYDKMADEYKKKNSTPAS